MNDKALLDEFRNVTVATVYSDRVDLSYTLDDRSGGSGFYTKVEDGCYYMVDIYNDYEIIYLADNLADALKDLNVYNDYFNYYPVNNHTLWDEVEKYWMTDFEYSLRSADDFEKVVNDMQSELKEGNE